MDDKTILAMKAALDKVLNDRRSIHAPCENAYMEKGRDGHVPCSCWRCKPEWV